ncbi:MAG: nicotinate-nicotinamide nucleotide adenylyltransferase [Dysosmobacter sp.]
MCDLELSRLGPSYTCDTVEQLAGEYPGADFWLIMGTDMFLSFHKWRQPEKIARYCRLAVVAREEQEKEKIQRQLAIFLKETLGVESDVVSCPVTVLSSTQVRQDVMDGGGEKVSWMKTWPGIVHRVTASCISHPPGWKSWGKRYRDI